MRTDILQDKKCVHVKLDKDVHAALRTKLFQHNLSMQEVFDEFAKLVASDDRSAERIVENLVMRKVREAIDGKPKRRSEKTVNELDHDAQKLTIAVGAIASTVQAHQKALIELYARQGLVMKAIKSGSLDMDMPDIDKEKATKPN
jgi:hypothetical protein